MAKESPVPRRYFFFKHGSIVLSLTSTTRGPAGRMAAIRIGSAEARRPPACRAGGARRGPACRVDRPRRRSWERPVATEGRELGFAGDLGAELAVLVAVVLRHEGLRRGLLPAPAGPVAGHSRRGPPLVPGQPSRANVRLISDRRRCRRWSTPSRVMISSSFSSSDAELLVDAGDLGGGQTCRRPCGRGA